jgi:hypothetical protein
MTPKQAVEWMVEHGLTSYKKRIDAHMILRDTIAVDELLKPTVKLDLLEKIDQEIADIEQEAQDRYNDWA